MTRRDLATKPQPSHSQAVKRRAEEIGFDLVGIAPADPPAHGDFYKEWLARGYAGSMGYLSRPDAVRRRLDPGEALAGARTIVVVAMNYVNGDDGPTADPSRPVFARYARGTDYHAVFEEKLQELAEFLEETVPGQPSVRCYVDYGPVLERDHAQRAGLGWIGKNTMLIHKDIGSYTFVGEILTDARLDTDEPFVPDHCGTCERCMDACPTGAIVAPREVDARRCISYLTIELRGPIPRDLRPMIGNRVFGCDICQEVCPWNDGVPWTAEERFRPRADIVGAELIELMDIDEDEFSRRYDDTPLSRGKRSGLVRNVAVALGNWGDPSAAPALGRGLNDEDAWVRGHSAWALGRLGTAAARSMLQARSGLETDDWVLEEIGLALANEPD
jgi:epoxyqueuosine reductase